MDLSQKNMSQKNMNYFKTAAPHSHADVEGLGVDEVLERGEGRAAFLSQVEHPFVREVAQLLEEKVVHVGVLVHAFCRRNKEGGGGRGMD